MIENEGDFLLKNDCCNENFLTENGMNITMKLLQQIILATKRIESRLTNHGNIVLLQRPDNSLSIFRNSIVLPQNNFRFEIE